MSSNQPTFDFRDPMDVIRAWIADQGIRITGLGSLKQDAVDVTDKAGNYGMLYQWYFSAVENENASRVRGSQQPLTSLHEHQTPHGCMAPSDTNTRPAPASGAFSEVENPTLFPAGWE